MQVTSIFSFYHNDFYSFEEKFLHFSQFEFVFCEFFQFRNWLKFCRLVKIYIWCNCKLMWTILSISSPSPIAPSIDLRTGGRWFDPRLGQSWFFQRIDDSHCDKIYSSLTAIHCLDNGYLGKQPVAWKEYCAEYWFKELQKNMDRCTGRRDITEILLKMALNTIQSINQHLSQQLLCGKAASGLERILCGLLVILIIFLCFVANFRAIYTL